MLDQETDAAWRSDVLATMAEMEPVQAGSLDQVVLSSRAAFVAPVATPPGAAGGVSPDTQSSAGLSSSSQPFYGKPLDYGQNFRNRRAAQTSRD
jgi:hypothetical protein